MNDAGYREIEKHLDVVLPEVFKQFFAQYPQSRSHGLLGSADDPLPCDAELFATQQLRIRSQGVDYYELQPELENRRFMRVGGDGCGNYHFMPGDDSNTDELWFWCHDPYDGFALDTDWSLSGFFSRDRTWELVELADPFASMGACLLLADHPIRAVLNPIDKEGWIGFVQQNDDLELDEHRYGRNPFTGEEVAFRSWPGRAKLTVEGRSCLLTHDYGAIAFPGDLHPVLEARVAEIAIALGASVWRRSNEAG